MSEHHVIEEVAWVAVLDGRNAVQHVTPYQLLSEPDRYRALADADPMYRAVTLRFLAALDLAAHYGGGLEAYLGQWHNAFWLRDAERPFYQHAELAQTLAEEGQAPNSVAVIDWKRAIGSSPLLWDHTSAATQLRYGPAEAVRALLWSAGAGTAGPATRARTAKVKSTETHTPNSPIASYCAVNAWGTTFADTLAALRESVAEVHRPGDRPVWERQDDLVLAHTCRAPAGTLEWLTWPARQHLLGWSGGYATAAVAVPGWYSSDKQTEWDERVNIDPFCAVSPKDDTKAMHAAQINSWREVELPEYVLAMQEHGPVAVEFIAQQLNKAKVEGCHVRRLRLEQEQY